MRKLILFFSVLSVFITSLLIINIYQTKDYENLQDIELGKSNQFRFYLQSSAISVSDHMAFLENLSEKYQVSIVRTDLNSYSISKSILLYKDTFPDEVFPSIADLNFDKGFYANYETSDERQVAKLPAFYSYNRLIVSSLTDYYKEKDRSINGTYTVLSTSDYDQNAIVEEISGFYGINKEVLLTQMTTSRLSIFNRYLILFAVILALSLLMMAILIIYQGVLSIKQIGIMKLTGFSNLSIISYFGLKPLYWMIASCLILDTSLFIFLETYPPTFFSNLLLSQALSVIYYLLLQCLVYLVSSNITIPKLLKNFADFKIGTIAMYVLKGLTLFVCSFMIANSSLTLKQINDEKEVKNIWEPYSSFLTLESMSFTMAGEADFSINGEKGTEELYQIFTHLEKSLNAYFVKYQKISPNKPFYDFKESVFYKPDETYETLTVNKNYLQALDLMENIPKSSDRFFLVPKQYEGRDLSSLFRAILYNLHLYSEQESLQLDSIPVTVYYYDQSVNTFSFDRQTNQFLQDPIFLVMDADTMLAREKSELKNTTLSSPIKIPNQSNIGKQVEQIVSGKPIYVVPKFTKIGDLTEKSLQFQETSLIIVLAILSITFSLELFVSIALSRIIFYSNQEINTIKKLLGLSFFDRYKKTFYLFGTIYFINFIFVFLVSKTAMVLPLFLIILILDGLLSINNIQKIEKKQMAISLKGG